MRASFDDSVLEFYATLPQQGPGSDEDAERALAVLLPHLPDAPVVADLGCGTGRSTLFLAERLRTSIIAVDNAACFCRRLAGEARRLGLSSRIDVRKADMAAPPIASESLDLLWCEGAAYIIGFAEALRSWRPLLRTGGWCVVSECSWRSDDPPDEVRSFFAAGYPAMTNVSGNVARASAAGYDVEATHVVSERGWKRYYEPIAAAIRDGRTDRVDLSLTRELAEELAIFERGQGSYGYVFYLMRKNGKPSGSPGR